MGDLRSRYFYLAVACEKDGKLLMMRRKRRYHPTGHRGQWMTSIGYKTSGHAPSLDAMRQFERQTGLKPLKLRYYGTIQLRVGPQTYDYVALFQVLKFEGELRADNYYGTFEWIPKERVLGPKRRLLWLPDRVLLKAMEEKRRLLLMLRYLMNPDGTVGVVSDVLCNHNLRMTPEELEEWR